MKRKPDPVYYSEYLQLNKLLDAQAPVSPKYGEEAHDEMLFIVVHQAYELWFKQMLHELHSVYALFNQDSIPDEKLMTVVHRLNRVVSIQELINQQIKVLETMTPQDFLEFRDYLVPASGFQSIQFKELEITLGVKRDTRIAFDQASFYNRINDKDRAYLEKLEKQPDLFSLVDDWLSRMPFLETKEFSFWKHYQQAITQQLDSDAEIIHGNPLLSEEEREQELKGLEATKDNFAALFDTEKYTEIQNAGRVRLSQKAMQAALFIYMYREEPVFNLPWQVLSSLVDIDEQITLWRFRHVMMVQRMLGSKIGTGGSSGHEYLRKTTEKNRIFADFMNLSTYLLPKSALPPLPEGLQEQLRRGNA
ncbi:MULTISPECIES: tryptophan 2,3-dioxygenase family protein [Gammaproteobacteria]|uniref:tryptophan 2,3-dioxygenase family protein n=1 Tax=Gammaproteobacteria TaxID=1236 RepID=UPI000DCFC735|nr:MULTISPECIES: tryptophan 2,3-dioxygenase family protein [Gammaproteobacteria]RTE86003.1 tryptophan 2,3-dioxygenase [Aliidiomarina sp. B3213]TCZ91357.1 tryptophan 2,3-dioxygenase [Lysobacter sp. N42]